MRQTLPSVEVRVFGRSRIDSVMALGLFVPFTPMTPVGGGNIHEDSSECMLPTLKRPLTGEHERVHAFLVQNR